MVLNRTFPVQLIYMTPGIIAVLAWIILTVVVAIFTKKPMMKWSGTSGRHFWGWNMRIYIFIAAAIAALITVAGGLIIREIL